MKSANNKFNYFINSNLASNYYGSTTICTELNVEQVSNLFMDSDEQVRNLFYS